MTTVPAAVIRASPAGLAVSRLLTAHDVQHTVHARGPTATRTRPRPAESPRMLTPNWMSRLPGWHYTGPDPAGYMPARSVAGYLSAYAEVFRAPVVPEDEVESLRIAGGGYGITTTAGRWIAGSVVVATGWCDRPLVPAV